jgi:hypothetical protein
VTARLKPSIVKAMAVVPKWLATIDATRNRPRD